MCNSVIWGLITRMADREPPMPEVNNDECSARIIELNNIIAELHHENEDLQAELFQKTAGLRTDVRKLQITIECLENILWNLLKTNEFIKLDKRSETDIHCYKNTYGQLPKDNRSVVIGKIVTVLYGKDCKYEPKFDWKKFHGV